MLQGRNWDRRITKDPVRGCMRKLGCSGFSHNGINGGKSVWINLA